MSFDPEKVRSYYQPVGWKPYEVVAKADYDRLLAMWHETKAIVEGIESPTPPPAETPASSKRSSSC